MTSPNFETPPNANTAPQVHQLQYKTQESVAQDLNADMQAALQGVQGNLLNNLLGGFLSVPLAIAAMVASAIANLLNGFGNLFDAITGTVDDEYVRQLPTINDHSQTIGQMRAELDQLTIHGMARVLSGDGTYYATPGTVRADIIMIGAGAGGGTGRYDLINGLNRGGGAGGGGGGEVHFTIHGSALFLADGTTPRAIPYTCGFGGQGGQVNEAPGNGGGNTSFDGIIAYGGQGGVWGGNGASGAGGFGIVIGGSSQPTYDAALRDSLSAFGLYGGGGAGGRGSTNGGAASDGGKGGLNPGGIGGGGAAPAVSQIAATGGGGGGGGDKGGGTGGAGAAPGGGGGGGGGAASATFGRGGNGANGIIYIIERAF